MKRLVTFSDKGNWKVVALCLLGATTFWFFNALNKDYATKIDYPIEFVFDQDGVVVVEELPKKVSIVVSGGGWNLLRKTIWFNIDPIKILLENPASQSYITKPSLASIISDQLSEIKLNYVVTDTLFIRIEERQVKKVAVAIDSSKIALENGYRIISPIRVAPDSISFIGPENFIKELGDSVLLYLPYSEINKDFNGDINLEEELAAKKVQVEPEKINVQFEVARFVREERAVKIEKDQFPKSFRFELADSSAVVSFLVNENQRSKVDASDFAVVADYRDINLRDSTVTLILKEVPEYAKRAQVKPEKVRLIYQKED